MEKYSYMSDAGSITLIHKSGAKLHLSNNFGDGSFDFYITKGSESQNNLIGYKDTGVWLNERGWKVMYYDCAKSYEDKGVELDSDFVEVYQSGTVFIFLVD